MARVGYIRATKNGVIREFTQICWDNLGTNKQGWRLVNPGDAINVEIIEKKNLAENQANPGNAAVRNKKKVKVATAVNDNVPGFEESKDEKEPAEKQSEEKTEINTIQEKLDETKSEQKPAEQKPATEKTVKEKKPVKKRVSRKRSARKVKAIK